MDMLQRIIVNGDSFSCSRPTANPPVKKTASGIVAKHLKVPWINLAQGGRGNRKIVAHTKIYFEKNPTHKINSLCIIQWSSPLRHDYITQRKTKKLKGFDTNFRTWNDNQNVDFILKQKSWDLDRDYALSQINDILDLQSYFKNNQIDYVMYFGLPNAITSVKLSSDLKALNNCIDYDRFVKPKDTHYKFVLRNDLGCGADDPHPSLDGHRQWANYIIDFLSNS